MQNQEFSFELITQDDNARLGKIFTPRGEIDTPSFMPVGTQGTVKGVFTDDIVDDDYVDHICQCGSSKCVGYILNEDHWPKLKKKKNK